MTSSLITTEAFSGVTSDEFQTLRTRFVSAFLACVGVVSEEETGVTGICFTLLLSDVTKHFCKFRPELLLEIQKITFITSSAITKYIIPRNELFKIHRLSNTKSSNKPLYPDLHPNTYEKKKKRQSQKRQPRTLSVVQ